MPSPFPGMNPYLERASDWENFHNSLIVAIRNRLTAPLRPRYFVALQNNVYIHEMLDEPGVRIGKPDLLIKQNRSFASGGATLLEAPAHARLLSPVEELQVPYLTITDRDGDRVVTVIEILSPSNKVLGPDRAQYLRKREKLLYSQSNLVEIDLLRAGPRLPAEDFPPCDYSVVVSRPATRPLVEVWPIMLREKLPTIAIPLQLGDIEPRVDLQELLHEVYDDAAFELVAYRYPPEPPLSSADQIWADEVLKLSMPL